MHDKRTREPEYQLDRRLYTTRQMTPEERADIDERVEKMAKGVAKFVAKRTVGAAIGPVGWLVRGWEWLKAL